MNISRKYKIHDFKGALKSDIERLFVDIRNKLGPLVSTPDVFITHGKLEPVTPSPISVNNIKDTKMRNDIEHFAGIISREMFPQRNQQLFTDYELVVRDVADSRDLSGFTQDWHIDVGQNPEAGKLIGQVIYYLDDFPDNLPIAARANSNLGRAIKQYDESVLRKRRRNGNNGGGREAAGGDLVVSDGESMRVMKPKAGRAISFNPDITYHKVVPLGGNRPLRRRMFIFIFKRDFDPRTNKVVAGAQQPPDALIKQYLEKQIASSTRPSNVNSNNNNSNRPRKKIQAVSSGTNMNLNRNYEKELNNMIRRLRNLRIKK